MELSGMTNEWAKMIPKEWTRDETQEYMDLRGRGYTHAAAMTIVTDNSEMLKAKAEREAQETAAKEGFEPLDEGAMELLATLIASNVDQAASINNRIQSSLEAERDMWINRCNKILNQLSMIPWESRTMPVQAILDSYQEMVWDAVERIEGRVTQ